MVEMCIGGKEEMLTFLFRTYILSQRGKTSDRKERLEGIVFFPVLKRKAFEKFSEELVTIVSNWESLKADIKIEASYFKWAPNYD